MNWKQLFCKHIWKQEKMELINSSIRWLFGIAPVEKNSTYAITFKCMKCKKEKLVEQRQTRELTLDEVKKESGY